jgi:hypothetical protein
LTIFDYNLRARIKDGLMIINVLLTKSKTRLLRFISRMVFIFVYLASIINTSLFSLPNLVLYAKMTFGGGLWQLIKG